MDFSKTKVAVATTEHSKLDVSSTHITTGNFMELMPVYYRHMIPGEHIKGAGNVLSRLAPVAVPTYGRCRINMRSFFVPFRTIMPNWNEFIVDTIAVNVSNASLVPTSPIVNNKEFVDWILGDTSYFRALDPNDLTDAAIIANDQYDFSFNSTYYVFKPDGAKIEKWLHSLGYKIIWDNKNNFTYSALPILAFAKVYLDWYANSAYLNENTYIKVQKLLKFNDPTTGLSLQSNDLEDIFRLIHWVNYDSGNDVFLNAWDNPMSPNNGLTSQFSIADITATIPLQTSVNMTGVGNNTPVMVQNAASNLSIGTTFLHQALKSMTDYVKRNQLSGAYAVDRFLARFGINLDSAKVDRSIYIGASSVDVDFGSVTQTVNTAAAGQPSNLGDYAGQGLGRGSMNFDFKCDEFGLFLVTYSIIPAAHLYQGYDRNNLHILKEQFFTPEYDNLGCSLIHKGEVYVSKNDGYAIATQYDDGFGFAPRFYEYKQKQDFVTGNFVVPSMMAGGDSWHLNRILEDNSFTSISQQTHSLEFTQGLDRGQYDRIFQYTNTDIDKFYMVFNFAVESLAPCKSLFDTYKFDDLGRELTLDAGGSKLN